MELPPPGPLRIIPCIECGIGLIYPGEVTTQYVTCWQCQRLGAITLYGSFVYPLEDFVRRQGQSDVWGVLTRFGVFNWLHVLWMPLDRYQRLGILLEQSGYGPGYLASIRLARQALGVLEVPDPLLEP